MKRYIPVLLVVALLAACQNKKFEANIPNVAKKVNAYESFPLTTDLSILSANQKEMLPLLFKAADIMDNLFWKQTWGDKETLLSKIDNPDLRRYAEINYGPWDRLNNHKPFIKGIDPKPLGSKLYPKDMTMEEFNQLPNHDKANQYTIIERNGIGKLMVVPYHKKWNKELSLAADYLRQAATLADCEAFQKYLNARAEALLSGDYYKSDMCWMDMKENLIDFVVGPLETYEDRLLGTKTTFEAYILIKDTAWSARLERLIDLLPQLQENIPVEDKYKTEIHGRESDLNVYNAIYYAGGCNAASKTITINLPNDPDVQMKKGSRKLQLKNSMQAKFEKILVPISNIVIHPSQKKYIDFDAFFENTMFHEVAHGLGIKETINGKGTVREALKETASTIEESKADILGLYIVTQLAESGELKEKDLMTNYVTFMAGIFRSVRFGAGSAHGKANMIRFNYFLEHGAFSKEPESGTYRIDFEKMKQAMNQLSEEILVLQGNGDYNKALTMIESMGQTGPELQKDLDKINNAGIPVDIVFEQGPGFIGL